MNSWAPLWSQVVDSSLWEEPPFVRVLFMTMLAKKDADHICRSDEYRLHKMANLSEQETAEAIKILSSPDTKRKVFKQEFEGRRIERVPEGWLILNGEKYRAMIQKLRRRAYKAQWQRDNRSQQLPGEARANKAYGDGDVDGFDRAVDDHSIPANGKPLRPARGKSKTGGAA